MDMKAEKTTRTAPRPDRRFFMPRVGKVQFKLDVIFTSPVEGKVIHSYKINRPRPVMVRLRSMTGTKKNLASTNMLVSR